MMKHTLLLLSFFLFAPQAQGLKMIVKAQNLATLKNLGYGESKGNSSKFVVEFDQKFNGSVLVLFTQTPEEKTQGVFPGLKNSYEGILRDGQLSIVADEKNLGDMFAEMTDKSIQSSRAIQSTGNADSNAKLLDAPPSVTLKHFLTVFNLAMQRAPNSKIRISSPVAKRSSER